MRLARRGQFSADAARIEQLHRFCQSIAAPRQGLHLDADSSQALHTLPHGSAGLPQLGRQPLSRMHFAVGQQHQQRRMFYAARERNSHSRLTRFSFPTRIRAMLLRWVKITNTATAPQNVHSGRLSGSSTRTATASATVANIVARPTKPESSNTTIQLKSNGSSNRSSNAATTPTTVAAPLPPRKSNHTG